MLGKIKDTINKYMKFASEEEKEKRMYRTIYNYWVYGNDTDEDFYFGFDEKSDEQKKQYMTLRYKLIYLNHLNDKAMQYKFDDKYETYKMFSEYYSRDVIKVNGSEDYDDFVKFVAKHKSFVVKPLGLSLAIGVYRVDLTDSTDLKVVFSEMLENGKLYQKNYWGKYTSVVVEELISQHEKISLLHKESVNGVRITTVRVNNEIHVYHPWIKVGVAGDFIASASQGGLDIGIDPQTGKLCTDGFNEAGEAYECHPTSGVRFKGFQIPEWDSLIKLAKSIAASLPQNVNYIGWDFALSDKGWCVMEGNYRGDFMWQMFNRKGMRQEFEDLIGWKFDKEYWWQ